MCKAQMLHELWSRYLRRGDETFPCSRRYPWNLRYTYYHFKSDILKREITYSTDKSFAANLVTISTRRAFDIINLNKKGVKPESLLEDGYNQEPQSVDLLDQDSVTRFDSAKKKKKKKKPANRGGAGGQNKEQKRPSSNNAPQE